MTELSLLTDEERETWENANNHHVGHIAAEIVRDILRALIAARAENKRMLQDLLDTRELAKMFLAENKRKDEMLAKAEEALIWASGAFQSEEESAAWAAYGRPIVDEIRALLQSEKGGE